MSGVESQSGHSISAHSRQASSLSARLRQPATPSLVSPGLPKPLQYPAPPAFHAKERFWGVKNNSDGAALIIVLLIVTIVTAIVVQFASDVYTATNALYNWTFAQKTSLIAKSGNELAIKTITENINDFPYASEPVIIPIDKLFAQSDAKMVVSVVDENSKINLNELFVKGLGIPKTYVFFKSLLKRLSLDETIADRVADWTDADKEPKAGDSEINAKDGPLDSIDELLLIKGIDRAVYDKIYPYVTIYGNGYINLNSAELPVLMALSDSITEEVAERIIANRKSAAFKRPFDVTNAGIANGGWPSFIGYEGDAFTITSTATDNKVQRTIRAVINSSGKVLFWQEI